MPQGIGSVDEQIEHVANTFFRLAGHARNLLRVFGNQDKIQNAWTSQELVRNAPTSFPNAKVAGSIPSVGTIKKINTLLLLKHVTATS
ncbi:MAG: hypothetical protein BVN35_10990 [Proteobacteria bacterium ST_bin11]|nr:MAG: hypothetical protein BVN35_10990 [Proteobacteria bacterium ST_bin11]